MSDIEKIKDFIERVKGEHLENVNPKEHGGAYCCDCGSTYPCDAIRAVLALEEMRMALERYGNRWPSLRLTRCLNEALTRAAQKIGEDK